MNMEGSMRSVTVKRSLQRVDNEMERTMQEIVANAKKYKAMADQTPTNSFNRLEQVWINIYYS